MTTTGKLLYASSVSSENSVQPKKETKMLKVDDNDVILTEVKAKYLN